MPGDGIQPYREDQRDEVVELLVRAFLANPLHLVLFGGTGPESIRQRRVLFEFMLRTLDGGASVVLVHDGAVAGFAHWVAFPGCRPTPKVMAEVGPRLLDELGPEVAARFIAWRRAWGEQDPETPHSHFGPLAVHPQAQGRGFGRRLLEHYCAAIDRTSEAGYLETERPQNVRIYRRSGFEVTAEVEVLGLPNWFMSRPAGGRAG